MNKVESGENTDPLVYLNEVGVRKQSDLEILKEVSPEIISKEIVVGNGDASRKREGLLVDILELEKRIDHLKGAEGSAEMLQQEIERKRSEVADSKKGIIKGVLNLFSMIQAARSLKSAQIEAGKIAEERRVLEDQLEELDYLFDCEKKDNSYSATFL